jgi:hypothetical protein
MAQILRLRVRILSRKFKALKEMSHFLFDFIKGDLTYYYKQCIDGMDEIRREAWSQGTYLTVKEKNAAFRLLEDSNKAKFALLKKGPSVLKFKRMEE